MNKLNKLIKLIESQTGKRVVLKEENYNINNPDKDKQPNAKMTTNEFERNPDKVKKLVSKGFDIKLTDLKEEETLDLVIK